MGHPVDDSSGKKIRTSWKGVPDDLDAAMKHSDGKTYFFKDGRYYKFDVRTQSDEEDKPSYPRDTGEYWFGCSSSQLVVGPSNTTTSTTPNTVSTIISNTTTTTSTTTT